MRRAIILGSGTSTGVPVIGCACEVCKSTEIKNKRTRASLALQSHGETLLIDTAPELRLQAIAAGISSLVGVCYTHTHADHTQGFDDLRAFSFKNRQKIPCYLDKNFHPEFLERFRYAFTETGYLGATPLLDLREMPYEAFQVGSFVLEPIRLPHGHVQSTAFRWGRFAYATDFKGLTPEALAAWKGNIDVLVASGIHFGQHKTHNVIEETLHLFDQLGVKRGIISHLAHDVDYVKHSRQLPPFREFAFDGMTIDLDATVS